MSAVAAFYFDTVMSAVATVDAKILSQHGDDGK